MANRRFTEGESSHSKSDPLSFTGLLADGVFDEDPFFQCDICADEKPKSASFHITGCDHSYCSDCIALYVASKLEENVSDIECPNEGCKVKLEPRDCKSILSPEVFDRWGDALCEASILSSERFYCPFKDCSVLLINDPDGKTQSECPECHRWVCAECKVPWHSEISCEEYKKLDMNESGLEDMKFMKLAEDNKWKRCPNCRLYVERSEGCLFMTCRCKCTFCYDCGVASTKDHYCENCKKQL